METKLQRLNLNLDSLFPGKTIEICGQIIVIKPLNIEQLAIISRTLKGYVESLIEDGVTWETVKLPSNMIKIAVTLLEQFPDVLQTATQIAKDDLLQLPIDIIVDLLVTVVEVNMESKEKLEGNLNSLIESLNIQVEQDEQPEPAPTPMPKRKLRKSSKG